MESFLIRTDQEINIDFNRILRAPKLSCFTAFCSSVTFKNADDLAPAKERLQKGDCFQVHVSSQQPFTTTARASFEAWGLAYRPPENRLQNPGFNSAHFSWEKDEGFHRSAAVMLSCNLVLQ